MKVRSFVLLSLLLVGTAAGCKDPITPEKIRAISVGDTKESVIELIGKPYHESKIDKPFDNGSGVICVKSGAWFHGSGFMIIHFDANKRVCARPADGGSGDPALAPGATSPPSTSPSPNAGNTSSQSVDLVLLKNGGRLRGTVVVDDPSSVEIKIAEGEIRKVDRADVEKVDYAKTDTASIVSPPTSGRESTKDRHTSADEDEEGQNTHVQTGKIIAGTAIATVGLIVAAVGAAGGANCEGKLCDQILMIAGGAAMIVGVVVAIKGLHKVPDDPKAKQQSVFKSISVAPLLSSFTQGVGLVGQF